VAGAPPAEAVGDGGWAGLVAGVARHNLLTPARGLRCAGSRSEGGGQGKDGVGRGVVPEVRQGGIEGRGRSEDKGVHEEKGDSPGARDRSRFIVVLL